MPGVRSPSSMAQKRSSSRRAVTITMRAGSNQRQRAGAYGSGQLGGYNPLQPSNPVIMKSEG